MDGFSVVMPIHNEEDFLPRSLPSVYALKPGEVLLLFDRCTDNSLKVARRYADALDRERVTRFIKVNHPSPGWKFRPAYLRRLGYQEAGHDAILNTAADIVHDPRVKKHMGLLDRFKLVSLGYHDYPWTLQCFLRHLISQYTPVHGFAGLLALSRGAWLETEDLEDLKQHPRAEDTHLHEAISSRYPTTHVNTRSLHLRPNETKQDHYYRGVAQHRVQGKSLTSSFLHSFIMLRPAVLTGYLHAKRGAVV